MFRGESKKDLDLIVYPHRRGARRPGRRLLAKMRDALRTAGMRPYMTAAEVRRGWRKDRKSNDQKHVEVWIGKGRRVDVLVFS